MSLKSGQGTRTVASGAIEDYNLTLFALYFAF